MCVGVPGPDARPSVPGADLVRHEKIITGSLYGSSQPVRDISIILDLYREGRMPLDKLITKRYELQQINEAFDDLLAGKLNRGVIIMA